MPDAASLIEAKAEAMARELNAVVQAKREAKIKALEAEAKKPKKKPTGKDSVPDDSIKPEDRLWTIDFEVSKAAAQSLRSPEEQAEMVALNWSWTCGSAHMLGSARHVEMGITAPGTTQRKVTTKPDAAFGKKPEHFMTFAEFTAAWNAALKAQDLRNYAMGKTFHSGDPYHVELPDERVPRSDPRVVACLKEYARLTRLSGDKKYKVNTTFEGKEWKSTVAPYVKAAEAEKKKQEAATKEALAKMRYSGDLSLGTIVLARGLARSGKASVPVGENILPPAPVETGKMKAQLVTGSAIVSWSMPKATGKPGTKPAPKPGKGPDVKVVCGLSYNLLSYELLSQNYLEKPLLKSDVTISLPSTTPIKVDVAASGKLALSQTGKAPEGEVKFDVTITSLGKSYEGSLVFKVSGPKIVGANVTIKD